MKANETYKSDTNNNLESQGFDVSTIDEITEQEIREYFTPENYTSMFGNNGGKNQPWDDVDFESYISAALEICGELGLIVD